MKLSSSTSLVNTTLKPLAGNLRPLLKGETLKNWLGEILENHLKKDPGFKLFCKKGSIFKLSLKKYPRPVHERPGPGPGTQAPMGYFSNSI